MLDGVAIPRLDREEPAGVVREVVDPVDRDFPVEIGSHDSGAQPELVQIGALPFPCGLVGALLGLDRPDALGDPLPVDLGVLERRRDFIALIGELGDLCIRALDLGGHGPVVVLAKIVVVEDRADGLGVVPELVDGRAIGDLDLDERVGAEHVLSVIGAGYSGKCERQCSGAGQKDQAGKNPGPLHV